jgi:hypothetical protein
MAKNAPRLLLLGKNCIGVSAEKRFEEVGELVIIESMQRDGRDGK